MKLLKLIILFSVLLAHTISAQTTKPSDGFEDYVLLKNGSKVYGKILYYAPNDTLDLQIVGGRIMRCAPDFVQKVIMAKPKTEKIAVPKVEKPYQFQERGVYGSAVYAMSFGRDKNGNGTHIGVGLQATAGYLFRRQFGVGGGLGYDSYYLRDGNANIYSAFAEARGYLSKRNRAEFFTLAIGYGQSAKTNNTAITTRSGGFLIQPTMGLRFGASARYNFFIDVGARFQQVHYDFSNQWIENRYTVTYQRWILRGGILF